MDYTRDAVLINEEAAARSSSEDESFPIDDDDPTSLALNGTLSTLQNYSTQLPNSSHNGTFEGFPDGTSPLTYIVPVLFGLIFIIGVLGNGTLIVIFIKHRHMRNVPNMFIVSLAIGDLLVILFCVPFTSTVYTVDSWPYGLLVCKFSEFVKDLSVGVSVFTLTALSADRYFAIVDPMRKLTGRRATRITIISIFGIWILSILVALPSGIYSYVRVFGPEYEEGDERDPEDDGRTFQVCYPYPVEFGTAYAQAMVMFHFLVYYAIPLLFIATFYIIMARHLVLSTRNMPGEAQGQVKQIQARKKVAKMILSFVVIFAICFFPHHLFFLWFYFYPDAVDSFNAFWNICRIVGFCLSFMNSCINPITLYCVSGTFRKQFNDHLLCCFCNNSNNHPSHRGRHSLGGTLPAGGGGGTRGGGLCAACVNLGGNNGQLHGNDSRYGNGSLGRGGNGHNPRGSTWEYSDRMMSKRKSTWETQTTVVNHRVLNMIGSSPNIHVNLCSEHEHIPLGILQNRKLGTSVTAQKSTVTALAAQGTTTLITPQETEQVQDPPPQQKVLKETEIIHHPPRPTYPSLIEEEPSSYDSHSKSYSDKVSEIFAKISSKRSSSPAKRHSRNSISITSNSEQTSTPPHKSPIISSPNDNEKTFNNNYYDTGNTVNESDVDEYTTLTSEFVNCPESRINRTTPIICYN